MRESGLASVRLGPPWPRDVLADLALGIPMLIWSERLGPGPSECTIRVSDHQLITGLGAARRPVDFPVQSRSVEALRPGPGPRLGPWEWERLGVGDAYISAVIATFM